MIPATTIQESPAQEIGNRSPWLKSIFLVALHFPVPSIFQPSTAEEKKKKNPKNQAREQILYFSISK
jgi:hypothetical protein